MDNETINILIASDINYAPYYGVMLTSLLINNKDCRFDIHLLTDSSWTDDVTKRFVELCNEYNSSFIVHIVNKHQLESYPIVGHINLSSYYNLFATKLLPTYIHKILYLDGDMIVDGNIRSLWNIDISEYACAMVPNCTYFDNSYYVRLQYESKYGYYNNGATLYNLDYLRQSDFCEKAFSLIATHPEKMILMDQDAQNALLHDKILKLPFSYNLQTMFFSRSRWNTYPNEFQERIMQASGHPVIIHYCDRLKPWHFRYYMMPYGILWNKYRRMSKWRDCKIKKPVLEYLKHCVKRMIKRSSLLDYRNREFIEETITLS